MSSSMSDTRTRAIEVIREIVPTTDMHSDAEVIVDALQVAGLLATSGTENELSSEWGIRYEKRVDPMMDGTTEITVDQIVRAGRRYAESAIKNGGPIDAKNRRLITREVTPWRLVVPVTEEGKK